MASHKFVTLDVLMQVYFDPIQTIKPLYYQYFENGPLTIKSAFLLPYVILREGYVFSCG